eukprot:1977248-Rhodomonas_salina.1
MSCASCPGVSRYVIEGVAGVAGGRNASLVEMTMGMVGSAARRLMPLISVALMVCCMMSRMVGERM